MNGEEKNNTTRLGGLKRPEEVQRGWSKPRRVVMDGFRERTRDKRVRGTRIRVFSEVDLGRMSFPFANLSRPPPALLTLLRSSWNSYNIAFSSSISFDFVNPLLTFSGPANPPIALPNFAVLPSALLTVL